MSEVDCTGYFVWPKPNIKEGMMERWWDTKDDKAQHDGTMTKEEKLIVEQFKVTYNNVAELQKQFDIVSEVAIVLEEEIERLKSLCTRAADALEDKQWNQFGLRDFKLVDELRKAVEWIVFNEGNPSHP